MRKKREWRKACAWLLCGALLSTALPQAGWAREGEPGSEENPIAITTDTGTQWGTASEETWYVVEDMKSISTYRISVQGTVHLMLQEGCDLNIAHGIEVSEGNTLIIDGTGSLTAKEPASGNAAIGGSAGDAGMITINGGTIDVKGGSGAAGIGGGSKGTGGTITIQGDADVNAEGNAAGAGIGGGNGKSGGIILIDGDASVTANGGSSGAGIGAGNGASSGSITINDCEKIEATGPGGAGIGGWQGTSGDRITINAGNIEAYGRSGGAGIGGSSSNGCGIVEINGGTILAESTSNGGAGIGAGSGRASDGEITISGGDITAKGGDQSTYGGAGIGGGNRAKACPVIITGGEIHATGGDGGTKGGDGIGNGGGYNKAEAATITIVDDDGAPVIFAAAGAGGSANAIASTSESVNWQGIIFENNTGQVYGNITLDQSFEVPADHTLMIAAGNTLTVPDGLTLTNNGTIDGDGTLIGTVTGKAPASTIDRGKVTITVTASTGGSASGGGEYDKDEEVSLKATAEPHYQFTGWYDGESKVSADVIYTFEAESDRTLTAKFEKTDHTFSDWQSDGNDQHFRHCTIAGCTAKEEAACSGGNATCTAKAVCTVCGAAYGETNPENHAEKAAWTTTATSHSKVYPCCKAVAEPESAHQWQDGVCTVCAYKCTHELQFVERVEATTSQTGVEAHYACDYCGLLFRDEAGAEPVSAEDLVIPEKETPSVTPSKPGVNVAASAHGSVSLSTKAPAYRETVTITPAPEAGYEVASVQVTDARGRQIAVTAQAGGTYTYTQPSGTVTITVTFAEKAEEPQPAPVTEIFEDLVPGAWYEDAVQYAYDNGLLTGTSVTTFAPDAVTTRGMVVSVLHRLAGSPAAEEDAAFDDVDASAWYGEAVRWAVSEGIVNGYSDTAFGPDDAVTREQLAAMLQSFSTWRGDADGTRSDLSGYEDASAVSGWALDAVEWANAQGLLNGTSATTLAPQGQATRAQVAAMLQRFLSA